MAKRSVAALIAALVAGTLLTSAPYAGAEGTEGAGSTDRGAGGSPPALAGIDLDTVTIPQLQARMAKGTLTPSALTSAYLKRIEAVDPKINAVLRTNPKALQQAAASDARHRHGTTRGPLDGIPVLLKDNIDTRDQPTTAGSLALDGRPPARDAALVTRLREAGAVILGKANLSEWANFRAEKPTSGWSAVGGQTRNPYVLDRNPCGSSAGSGAALAASLSQVAIGSETDGSIVCPAGMNGVVGHKPSLGLVSGDGVVPISSEQDTAGPMARNVTDTALTLAVLSGADRSGADGRTSADANGRTGADGRKGRTGADANGRTSADGRKGRTSADANGRTGADLTRLGADVSAARADAAAPGSLRGKRIGLWRLPSLGDDVDAVLTRAAKKLRKAGATVVEVTPPYQDRLAELEFPALLSEFHRDINAYLATREGPRNLAELVEFNRATPGEQTCFSGQELFEQALEAPPTTDPEYKAMRAELKDLSRRSIDETMAEHRLDAIASPANPPAWTTDCARGDNDVIPSSTPAAVAGYPALSVPAGSVGELPVGVLLMAGDHQDARLLALGAKVEARLDAWHAPRYLPTVDRRTSR